MDDARVRRNHAEVFERALAPAKERVTLPVTVEFDLVVEVECVGAAVTVDLYRVIDDQLGRRQRIDAVGIATQFNHRIAHGGEVDDGGHAREVLQDDAARRKRNLGARRGGRIPVRKCEDVVPGDIPPVFEPKQVLEQDFQGVGESVYMPFADGIEPVDFVFLAANIEGGTSAEAVRHDWFSGVLNSSDGAGPSGAAL